MSSGRRTGLIGMILTVAVLTVVWIVYSENARMETVLSGVAFAALCLGITNAFVLKGDYRESYHVSVLAMLKYIPFLVVQIYISGFDAIYRVITRHVKVGVVDITTTLPNDYLRALLSTAITLTPGTVTLDQDGQNMTIIWLNCATTDPEEAGREIKGPFEGILMPRGHIARGTGPGDATP